MSAKVRACLHCGEPVDREAKASKDGTGRGSPARLCSRCVRLSPVARWQARARLAMMHCRRLGIDLVPGRRREP